MGFGIKTIQRDFAKHRKKAALLGVLFAVMVGLWAKAFYDPHPQLASAEVDPGSATPSSVRSQDSASAAEAEDRIRQSKELWRALRDVRGAPAVAAFTFDPSYFTMDPSRQPAPQTATPTPTASDSAPVLVDPKRAQQAHIDDLSRLAHALMVRSTIMGNAGNKPKAIVNQQLLSIGDTIQGFEITAIRAREVEFTRDGVTFAVKMSDDLHGS